MEFQEVLEKRTSVRSYLPQEVEEEKIQELIQAAILAPSWKNSQVTRYYVVTSKEKLAEVKGALPLFNQKNVENAPLLIVSSIVLNRAGFERDGTPSNELGNGWGYYDCGLHNMNLLLKAADLGLSTLVMGIRNEDTLRKALDIPETESIVSVIGVGYSNADAQRPKRKTVQDIARFF